MPAAPPLTGEPLALDLVNTRSGRGDGAIDHLRTLAGLRAWLDLEADRLPDDAKPAAGGSHWLDAAVLSAVHAVREHASSAIDRARRGARPSQPALRGLNAAQWAAPAVRELSWKGRSLVAPARRRAPFADRLAAHLAEATVELLVDPGVRNIRTCEADDCTMQFLPAHPRRRWCSAARCGNRVRVARHYHRQKDA